MSQWGLWHGSVHRKCWQCSGETEHCDQFTELQGTPKKRHFTHFCASQWSMPCIVVRRRRKKSDSDTCDSASTAAASVVRRLLWLWCPEERWVREAFCQNLRLQALRRLLWLGCPEELETFSAWGRDLEKPLLIELFIGCTEEIVMAVNVMPRRALDTFCVS